MNKLTFIDKINVLFSTSINSKIFLILLILLIVFGVSLFKTNKQNEKKHKIIYIAVTVFMFLYVFISYFDSIGKIFSYMMNNFFIVVFFPNLAIYLAALIITSIIVWISIFSYKTPRQIKILNITIYIIINYLFALSLSEIKQQKLDVFSQSAIYENKVVSSLISLSSTIFIIWIIFLIIYKILLIYIRKDYKPKVKKVIVKRKVKQLPENFIPTTMPSYIYGNTNNKEINYIRGYQKSKEYEELKKLEKKLTLEDYKLLLKMLTEEKKRKKREKEIQEEKEREIKKYDELLELYRIH